MATDGSRDAIGVLQVLVVRRPARPELHDDPVVERGPGRLHDVEVGGRPVSSTLVRRAVAGGDLDAARAVLGRPYSMTASVVPGAGRGRDIGYRTINLELPDERKLLPPDGVYLTPADAPSVVWTALVELAGQTGEAEPVVTQVREKRP